MAGSALTVTVEGNPQMDLCEPYKVILDWTSASGGTVSLAIASTYATAQAAISPALPQPSKLQGYIKSIETIPGEEGDKSTSCPTASYDITLDDAHGYDLAGGELADRSNSAAEKITAVDPIPIDDEITLSIANAGNSKKGRIILHIDPKP